MNCSIMSKKILIFEHYDYTSTLSINQCGSVLYRLICCNDKKECNCNVNGSRVDVKCSEY